MTTTPQYGQRVQCRVELLVRATSLKLTHDHKTSQILDLIGIEIATAMPYIADMLFIEAPKFTELVKEHLSDDEYAALQWMLREQPDAGSVVPGSGGVRKVRWDYAVEVNAVALE